MTHHGPGLVLSQDASARGEKWREAMDVWVASGKPISPAPLIEVLPTELCRHRSSISTGTTPCKNCQGEPLDLPTFGCARFGSCTERKRVPHMGCCRGCELFEAIPKIVGDPLVNTGDPYGDHIRALEKLAATDFAYPGGEGAGILWVGGGKYWPGIVAGLKTLREIGCTLPVEIWHDAETEPIDVSQIADCEPFTVRNIRDVQPTPQRIDGWENKITAIRHSGLEQIVFVDADAYPVADPKPLFDRLSVSPPFLFWDDLERMRAKIRWQDVWPKGNTGIPPVQGGQLVIDRRRAWKLIELAHWQNQHSDHYYRRARKPRHLYYGDQHAWNVAAAVLDSYGQTGYWASLGPAPWRGGVAFVCSMDGAPYVVHRCGGKLFAVEHIPVGKSGFANPRIGRLPMEAVVFKHYAKALEGKRDAETEFTQVYRAQIWGNPGSGAGSRGPEAAAYLAEVNPRIHGKSVVDLGCGDGTIAKDLACQDYVGFECAANAPWLAGRRARVHLDFFKRRDELPPADVCLCKDVLHHWPSWMVSEFVAWLQKCGKFSEVLLTQDVHQQADLSDTYLGGYRALHPHCEPLKPFGLEVVSQFLHKCILRLPLLVSRRPDPAITAIGDLHGRTPAIRDDSYLVLLAGDICPDLTGPKAQAVWMDTELRRWLDALPCPCVAVPGNHDRAIAAGDYPRDLKWTLLTKPSTEIAAGMTIFGMPWVLGEHCFGATDEVIESDCERAMPDRVDIVLSHTPPIGVLENSREHPRSFGLRHWIHLRKPKLAVFGHCHGSRGGVKVGETYFVNATLGAGSGPKGLPTSAPHSPFVLSDGCWK